MAVLMVSVLAFSCASAGGGAQSAEPGGVVFSWDFDDPAAGTQGWRVADGEFWDYKGTATLSRDDTTFGNGMLRFDVDFTADTRSEWSEPKIKTSLGKTISMRGITKLTFDFYYNPGFSTSGSFNSKVIAQYGTNSTIDAISGLINAQEDAGNGYLKTNVTLSVRSSGSMDSVILSIAGYLTDYKGPVFFDNIQWE